MSFVRARFSKKWLVVARPFCFLSLLIFGIVQGVIAQSVDRFKSFAEREETVEDILKGPQNRPRSDTYYLIAISQARKNKVRDALVTIEKGLGLEPGNTRLMNLRAALWARMGRTGDAVAEFERVLAIQPENNYARESLQQLVPSRKSSRQVVVTPSVPDAPLQLAADKRSGSSSLPERPEPPKILEAKYFTAMKYKQKCFFQLSAIKRARQKTDKAAAGASAGNVKGTGDSGEGDALDVKPLVATGLLPAEPVCPENGIYKWKSGEPACTVHGAFSQVEVEINTLYTDFNRGMIAKMSGNFREAKQAFEQVIVLYPRWSEAYYQLADTFFRMGDETPALEKVKTCVKIDPSNVDAQLLMANIYFKTGFRDAATGILDKVARNSSGTVYGLSARSLAKAIRSGKNYYQIFPP